MKLVTLLTIIAFIVIIVFGPLVTIWALNVLFHLNIPFTFWTWLASAVLTAIFTHSNAKSK